MLKDMRKVRPLSKEEDYYEQAVDEEESSESSDADSDDDEEDDEEDDALDSDDAEELYQMFYKQLKQGNREIEHPRVQAAVKKIQEKKKMKWRKEAQMSQFQKFCYRMAQSRGFDGVIFAIVLVNIILMCLQTCEEINLKGKWYFTMVDQFCLGIYIVEMMIKMIGLGRDYFKDSFNWLDFFVVVVALLDYTVVIFPMVTFNGSALRAFRVFRALKAIKMMKSIRLLRSLLTLLKSVTDSLMDCVASMVLLLFIMYIYAFAGLTYFKEVSPENFGDFFRAFFSMFQLCTFDDWFDMYDQVKIIPEGHILFFITFMIFCSFIILNYVTAVLTDKACDAAVKVNQNSACIAKIRKSHQDLFDNPNDKNKMNGVTESEAKLKGHYNALGCYKMNAITEILALIGEIEKRSQIFDGHMSVHGELIDAAVEHEQ